MVLVNGTQRIGQQPPDSYYIRLGNCAVYAHTLFESFRAMSYLSLIIQMIQRAHTKELYHSLPLYMENALPGGGSSSVINFSASVDAN